MLDPLLHIPDFITNLPAVKIMARAAVENPTKGQRKTEDREVLQYFHYTKRKWCACYFLHPEKDLGTVLLMYDSLIMMQAKGHVAMQNAMEMIDHWVRTGYVPRVPDSKCLADYKPGARYNAATSQATGKATKPFTV